MERVTPVPTTRAPAETFSGDVWFDVMCRVEGEGRMRVNTVRFSPRARTAWHSHSKGQSLFCTEGVGLVVTRDQVIVLRPGESVWTPAGEEHWHGAASDRFMTHLAMWEGDDTAWGDLVTDTEYDAALAQL